MPNQWIAVGKLDGKTVWKSCQGRLAIERDFEQLCELTNAEIELWEQMHSMECDDRRNLDWLGEKNVING